MSNSPGHRLDPDLDAVPSMDRVTVYTSKGRRRRRRAIIGGVLLSVLFSVTIGGYVALAGKIHTFDGSGLSAVQPAATNGQNILLIGTDSRAGANAQLGGGGNAVGRSDTTILMHVYPGATSAVAVSIPRDTLVTIPACKLPNGSWTRPQSNVMFNSAYSVGLTAAGNPACTVNTVQKLTGLRVDHTVVANFAGFAATSQAVGGVPVCLPKDVHEGDLKPEMTTRGKLLFHAGLQTVSGQQALDYVRIRHGIGDGSDIGRIKRQQAFLASLVMTIRHKGLTPSHILPLVNAATANLTFDPSLSGPASLFSFAMGLTGLKPSGIDFITMPWRYAGARVAIVQPDANVLWSALRNNQRLNGKTPATKSKTSALPRGTGAVKVLNGTLTTGLAGTTARQLTAAGFAARTGNAPRHNYVATEIHYRPADEARARLLARYLKATLVADPQATTLTVYVGKSHQWLAGHQSGSASGQQKVPSSITHAIRSATANPCSNLSYG